MGNSASMDSAIERPLIICFSHLRWDFVFQRPQHIMTRLSDQMDIIFWEEPVLHGADTPALLDVKNRGDNITIVTPHIPQGLTLKQQNRRLTAMLEGQLAGHRGKLVRWYYTPMMLEFSRNLSADCTVYDCMDELANFDFAPKELADRERELFEVADLVFTGGYSLYEAKKSAHPNVHPFPSSVDRDHFHQARSGQIDPSDQAAISYPRLGYYGVIDERMDLDLIASLADKRPDWSIILLGPVVKVDPDRLPRRANLHYLGRKDYSDLPSYAAGWDVALMPFALNEATRFISPTKTPEYLAAGLPVVSTPIVDVERHYGALQAVTIAADAEQFAAACEDALQCRGGPPHWLTEADLCLAEMSWNSVTGQMLKLIHGVSSRQNVPSKPHYDYLVVGAGFAGAVMAERLAEDAGKRVLVIDRRDHIGGNAFDCVNEDGILIHQYGPHIFHTNSSEIVNYLSRFTDWRPYEHRVLAATPKGLVPIPINRTTLNVSYDLNLTSDDEAADFLAKQAENVGVIETSEDVVVSQVGRELYNLFFRGYTRKQWGMDPSDLDKSVTARVPTRMSSDDRYFTDSFQAMPAKGYTAMFSAMLNHPNIDVKVGTDFQTVRDEVTYDRLIYTGPIDEYFDHCYGPLPYRSLRFMHQTFDFETYQPTAVVNYPDENVPYTRITEYKYLTGQEHRKTSVTFEYPQDEGDPYYPIPRKENRALYARYEALAKAQENVIFVGRLATYQYYNMDQVVGQALATYRRHAAKLAAQNSGSVPVSAPANILPSAETGR